MVEIKCNNYFCIYFNEEGCILEKVFLNICGCCESCTYVEIEKDYIKKQRETYLKQSDEY